MKLKTSQEEATSGAPRLFSDYDVEVKSLKERLKTKLTTDIILDNYHAYYDEEVGKSLFLLIFLSTAGVSGVAFGIYCLRQAFNMVDDGGIFGGLVLTLASATIAIFTIINALKSIFSLKNPKNVKTNNVIIVEDYVVDKKIESGSDDDTYYIYLKVSGRVEVGHGPYVKYCRPDYREVSIGDKFYVPRICDCFVPLLYSRYEWRSDDLTDEQLAQELREEDELIESVMQCERFPKFTVRKNHYADTDSMGFLKGKKQKTDAEKSFLERLTAKHFDYDRVNAIEYVIRYCPPDIQRKVVTELTEKERSLWLTIADHIKKDKKQSEREARKQRFKNALTGSDTYD